MGGAERTRDFPIMLLVAKHAMPTVVDAGKSQVAI